MFHFESHNNENVYYLLIFSIKLRLLEVFLRPPCSQVLFSWKLVCISIPPILSITSRHISMYSPKQLLKQCFPQFLIPVYVFSLWFLNSILQICCILLQSLVSSAQIYCNYFSQCNLSTLNSYFFNPSYPVLSLWTLLLVLRR